MQSILPQTWLASASEAWLAAAPTISRATFLRWLGLGLALRLVLSPLYGTQDVEWWKAWGTFAVHDSLIRVYGAPDDEMLRLWRSGKTREEIRSATQTVIPFEPYQYFRKEYRLTQPPIYIYSLYLSTRLYGLIAPDLRNSRLFNAFVNLQPILASGLLTWLIVLFVRTAVSVAAGRLAGLAYWLNPVVLLNSPIQGYQDPLCALFATVSVIAAFRRRIEWAFAFLVFSFLTKPQGVLIAPIIVVIAFRQHSASRNLRAWVVAAATGLLVALPYLVTGHVLSVIQGVLSISDSSNDLSRQSLNLWWPVQYLYNAIAAIRGGQMSAVTALLGGSFCWSCDVPASQLTPLVGFPVQILGLTLLAGFTALNLRRVWMRQSTDQFVVIEAALLQVYAYFILRVGVQGNHYFTLIPLFALICARSARWLKLYVAVSLVFFVQDFIFYGLGRDFNYGVRLLSQMHLGWTTNAVAAANIILFAWLCRLAYRDPISTRS